MKEFKINKTIDNILEEMKTYEDETDFEIAHQEGDWLLIETLKAIAEGTQYAEKVNQIIESYSKIGKWYA